MTKNPNDIIDVIYDIDDLRPSHFSFGVQFLPHNSEGIERHGYTFISGKQTRAEAVAALRTLADQIDFGPGRRP